MTYWIKRIAAMLSVGSFFIGFFMSVDPADPFDAATLVIAIIKGGAGALLFWAVGFVVADIVIKGLVADLHTGQDDFVKGGLLQRLYTVQSQGSPDTATASSETVATIRLSASAGVAKRK